MKVIILAAGLGTRLGELTKKTPKPLIKIGDKTVLTHIVDRLQKHNLKEIIVKMHYFPEQIVQELGDKVMYYYEPVLHDWKETVGNLRYWIQDGEFMVINGDTMSEIDYTDMIDFHHKGDNKITAFMDDWRCAGTWIYGPEYFREKNIQVRPYRPSVSWYDIGTPERLDSARKHFELGEKNVCP